MIYFISDTHFFHQNIIKYCDRPFPSVEEMNEQLIKNWNQVVTEEDEVYFLGDFAMRGSTIEVKKILQQLKGRKYLIRGNHDKWLFKESTKELLDLFEEVHHQCLVLKLDNKKLFLQHKIPLQLYGKIPKNCDFFVYGHTHGVLPAVAKDNRYLNVSVETLDYTPRTFYELERYNERRKRKQGEI